MRLSGYLTESLRYYERALGFDDRLYDARVELVDALVRLGRRTDAESHSQVGIDNYKLVRPFYASRALVLGYFGSLEEAFRFSDTSVGGGDRNWYSRCVRAELFLRIDPAYRPQAMELFREAVALAEEMWAPALHAGLVLLEHGAPALAAAFLTEAAHQNPRAALCWLKLGDCFRDLRFYEQAEFYYGRVAEVEPANSQGLERISECGRNRFGLLRGLFPAPLRDRWEKAFERALRGEE
jgi:tetratricopeptide (TPR) repeat protein